MAKEQNKDKVLIGSVLVILAVTFLFFAFVFVDSETSNINTLSISLVEDDDQFLTTFDFCSTEQGCRDYLSQNGMPSNFLELNGYTISCENGICYAKKI